MYYILCYYSYPCRCCPEHIMLFYSVFVFFNCSWRHEEDKYRKKSQLVVLDYNYTICNVIPYKCVWCPHSPVITALYQYSKLLYIRQWFPSRNSWKRKLYLLLILLCLSHKYGPNGGKWMETECQCLRASPFESSYAICRPWRSLGAVTWSTVPMPTLEWWALIPPGAGWAVESAGLCMWPLCQGYQVLRYS